MVDIPTGQQRHNGGNPDTIIRSQRRSIAADPIVLNNHADPFGFEIENGIRVLLMHHI